MSTTFSRTLTSKKVAKKTRQNEGGKLDNRKTESGKITQTEYTTQPPLFKRITKSRLGYKSRLVTEGVS
jgi:hypothetical protein